MRYNSIHDVPNRQWVKAKFCYKDKFNRLIYKYHEQIFVFKLEGNDHEILDINTVGDTWKDLTSIDNIEFNILLSDNIPGQKFSAKLV